MTSSRMNILSVLYRSGKTVFRLKDIALLTSETNFQSLNKKINLLVKKGELLNIRKGIYSIPDYNNEELSAKIFSPSYLSLDYVLQKEGVIFQYNRAFTSISYLTRAIEINNSTFIFKKIKNEILVNTTGIEIYPNGTSIASPERALLDYIYLYGDSYFDNPGTLNDKKIKEILPIYNSQILNKRIEKLLQDA